MGDRLLDVIDLQRGHFSFESGHHGDIWIDLDALFARPTVLSPHVDALTRLVAPYDVEMVCGPLVGGAFVAYDVATRLGVGFCHSEKIAAPAVDYALRCASSVAGARVAVVDDAINAGSATGSTLASLRAAGAVPVVLGALIVLGGRAALLAESQQVPLEAVAILEHTLEDPGDCWQCAANTPLQSL